MQNTKGLITLAIYMVILLLFPVFSGLEEVFVGISLSFTIGFFFFICLFGGIIVLHVL